MVIKTEALECYRETRGVFTHILEGDLLLLSIPYVDASCPCSQAPPEVGVQKLGCHWFTVFAAEVCASWR